LLDLGKTYYWAVDEANSAAPGGVDAGPIWQFRVIDHLVVDDMEAYGLSAPAPLIFLTWRDGIGDLACVNNGTGSQVDMDRDYFYDPNQSMKLTFDNDGQISGACGTYAAAYFSMVKAEVSALSLLTGIGSDWTEAGAKALVLYFYGSLTNPVERMWVQLTDSAGGLGMVEFGDYADEDRSDIKEIMWHRWVLSLADFEAEGVDTEDVNSIAIGIGDYNDVTFVRGMGHSTSPGGVGAVYFDAIGLYSPTCTLSRRSPAFGEADYWPRSTDPNAPDAHGDCKVNYNEVGLMMDDWLESDWTAATAEPISVGPVASYQFENNANDSSGNGHHGTLEGYPALPVFVDDPDRGYVVDLTDANDHIITDANAADLGIAGDGAKTTCAWALTRAFNGGGIWELGEHVNGRDWSLRTETSVVGATGWRVQLYGYMGQPPTPTYDFDVSIPESDNEWCHFALVYDGNDAGNEVRLYANGFEVGSNVPPTPLDTASSPKLFSVGRWSGSYFDGRVDDVRVYDYALTHGQVVTAAGFSEAYSPVTSPANISDDEPKNSKKVNFRDYAELMDQMFLEELWP
jgi:hypothetical protein